VHYNTYVPGVFRPDATCKCLHSFNFLPGTETTGKVTMMITPVTKSTIQRTVIAITTVAVDIALDLTHHHVSTVIVLVHWSNAWSSWKVISPQITNVAQVISGKVKKKTPFQTWTDYCGKLRNFRDDGTGLLIVMTRLILSYSWSHNISHSHCGSLYRTTPGNRPFVMY